MTVQRIILDELAALTAEMGTTVLMVTHNLALAAERADHLVVMNRGRIVESGPVGVVLPAPTDDYTKRLIAAGASFSTRPSSTALSTRESPPSRVRPSTTSSMSSTSARASTSGSG